MSNKKKPGKKSAKDKAKTRWTEGVKTPHAMHEHPHKASPSFQFESLNICDKEDCAVNLPAGQPLCDRHDFAIRAIVGRYLMPSLAEDNWAELLTKARSMGVIVNWADVAITREVSHPEGWGCAVCGGGLEPAVEGDDVVWIHRCNPAAIEEWEQKMYAAMTAARSGGAPVIELDESGEGSGQAFASCPHLHVHANTDREMITCVDCGSELSEIPDGAEKVEVGGEEL